MSRFLEASALMSGIYALLDHDGFAFAKSESTSPAQVGAFWLFQLAWASSLTGFGPLKFHEVLVWAFLYTYLLFGLGRKFDFTCSLFVLKFHEVWFGFSSTHISFWFLEGNLFLRVPSLFWAFCCWLETSWLSFGSSERHCFGFSSPQCVVELCCSLVARFSV